MDVTDLVDLELIKRLKYKYLRCLDQKLWDEIADCFTPDAVAEYSAGAYSHEGRDAIVAFLKRKWAKELDYRLVKELWAFDGNHIAVRFQYEWHDAAGNWFRSYGNEQWEFDETGYMQRREASINDLPIAETDRKFLWPPGVRPADDPGLDGI